MKILKVFILALGCTAFLSACGGPQPDFHVSMTLLDEDLGEDSNSTEQSLTINGYEGDYRWVYAGYHPNENFDRDRSYSFTLDDEDLQALTLLIRENGLMTSREDTVGSGNWWSSFDVTWNNSMGGQSAQGHVTGLPASEEDMDPRVDPLPEDESKFAVEQVMNFVQEKVGFNE